MLRNRKKLDKVTAVIMTIVIISMIVSLFGAAFIK